ncbi:Flp pilus assembly protein TadG [Streptacidiphilus sp. MAP12-16]|uniref:TadE/TadG family type IV pilus assembly protein n=1 Tax=Streptacidiphilus sp. MAP12-16 TaxID=3156300 RepID=UPI00351588CE
MSEPEPGCDRDPQGRACRDRGSAATETALIMPLLIMLLLLSIGSGRLVSARQDVDQAAHAAARAASLARSPGEAVRAAQQAAATALASAGLACSHLDANISTADYHPGGQVGVSLACTASLSGLTGVPMPGHHTVQATSTSVIDTYRGQDPQ